MPSVTYKDAGEMPLQTADWTCAACSLAWMNRALSIGIAQDEWSAVDYIGQPTYINADYGLMDASGARLAQCLTEQGAASCTCWPSWEQLLELAERAGLLIGGIGWNHWVAVRYRVGDSLCIANSAPGWGGVTDMLGPSYAAALGPFAAVVVPIQYTFPDAESLQAPQPV